MVDAVRGVGDRARVSFGVLAVHSTRHARPRIRGDGGLFLDWRDMRHYDVLIIGSGPAGQKAAIQAAKLGKKAAIVERAPWIGGAALNTGTIPSKALREAILHLTGAARRGLFGDASIRQRVAIGELISVSQHVILLEREVVLNQLTRNSVDIIQGHACFDSPRQITATIHEPGGTPLRSEQITADYFVIAVGTKPAMPPSVPFQDDRVFTSDGLLKLDKLPKSMIVVGGGVIGTEYACMLAAAGVKVILVEGRRQVLGFLDEEITEAFQYHMRQAGITLRLGEKVKQIRIIGPGDRDYPQRAIRKAEAALAANAAESADAQRASHEQDDDDDEDEHLDPAGVGAGAAGHMPRDVAKAVVSNPHLDSPDPRLVLAVLESGKKLRAATLLYAVGRQGTTSALCPGKAGLAADDRQRLSVNEHYQTNVPHIYAVGDVIGFPALVSSAMEQGRLAVCHMFGVEAHSFPELFPYGIYSIPEISMVGRTEGQLTEAGVPYESGVANYREIARGQLLGDETGMLKMLIHPETREVLGVHCIGSGATELIHIGQCAMALGGKADFFANNVFNYPTLAEAYRVAALNGLNKIRNM